MKHAKQTLAAAFSGALALTAATASAEPNQELSIPRKGLSAQLRGGIGSEMDVAKFGVKKIDENSFDENTRSVGVSDFLSLPTYGQIPTNDDAAPRFNLTLRKFEVAGGEMVFNAGVKYDGDARFGIAPDNINAGIVMTGKDNTGLIGTLGLLPALHMDAFSSFKLNHQPLTLLTDHGFSEKMTLSHQLGTSVAGKMEIGNTALFLNYRASVSTGALTAREGQMTDTATPATTGKMGLQIGVLGGQLGAGIATGFLPGGEKTKDQFSIGENVMMGWGNIEKISFTAVGENTNVRDSEKQHHMLGGGLLTARFNKYIQLYVAGAYTHDVREVPAAAVTANSAGGEFGTCVSPLAKFTPLDLCGAAGASHVTIEKKDEPRQIAVPVMARAFATWTL